jgi:hypothetical protein
LSPSYFEAAGPTGEKAAVARDVAYFLDPDGAWFEIPIKEELDKVGLGYVRQEFERRGIL